MRSEHLHSTVSTRRQRVRVPLAPGVTFLEPNVPVHVLDSGVAGPTAVFQAGIHGDEIAGVHALAELLEEGALTPARGRVLVCPVMNAAAYRARQRAAPGGLDLNRQFPGDADAPERERRLARRFMDLMDDDRDTTVLVDDWRWHCEGCQPGLDCGLRP